jgi:DNA-binding CsgD family transcriptional regulator
MLAGLDKDWSAWGRATLKEYANLSDGKYEFMVKAKNQLGVESIPDSVVFVIQSPWYKSVAAYFAYLIMFISALLLLAWTTNMRIEASGRRERLNNLRVYRAKEQEYIRQALESEKELIRIRSEKLQAEMILRDKELANQAMNLVRKNEFLLKMKDELQNLKRNCQDETVSDRILQIINRLNREVDSNKQREIFELAFDEVHEDFLNRLKSRYPTLTPTELRLCAFLKMNISTKEIAPLMNISIRGVEICRYRVRKKMGITRDTI